jgi:hypothetical protein
MTPNLFLATQTLFSPHKWFKSQKGERPMRQQDHWDSPVPGIYEYIPGRGWYLIATDKDPQNVFTKDGPEDQSKRASKDTTIDPNQETIKVTPPIQVKYSKVLKRYLLAPDYEMRKRHGRVLGSNGKSYTAGFFRLDDGIAWVECWDQDGEFIPGPYKLWCIDQATGNFRHMLKGDDPAYISHSRQNSFEGDNLGLPGASSGRRRGNSQDSRSTQFRSGAGSSTRDGPSVPSTRPNSIKTGNGSGMLPLTPSQPQSRNASRAGSRSNSRRNSPKRSPGIPLDEAKERLMAMAKEQNERSRSRANSEESRRGRGGAEKETNKGKGKSPAVTPITPAES